MRAGRRLAGSLSVPDEVWRRVEVRRLPGVEPPRPCEAESRLTSLFSGSVFQLRKDSDRGSSRQSVAPRQTRSSMAVLGSQDYAAPKHTCISSDGVWLHPHMCPKAFLPYGRQMFLLRKQKSTHTELSCTTSGFAGSFIQIYTHNVHCLWAAITQRSVASLDGSSESAHRGGKSVCHCSARARTCLFAFP